VVKGGLTDGHVSVKVLVSAFQCCPGYGSEPATGWHWATTLAEFGHEVTVLTGSSEKDRVLAARPPGVDFRFIDQPPSPLGRFSQRVRLYDGYRRWQDKAFQHIEQRADDYDVVHHVTWGSLHLGSQLWRLRAPLVYGPIGGGQTAPASYWRYFGREWPAETLRTASTGRLLQLNSRSRETIQSSAVTLVCNSATAAAVERLGARDVRFMLADGLPVEWLGEPRVQPAGTPVVFWVGRLLPRKAPTLAVEAFARLRRVMPAKLVIAGDGPLRDQVRATIDRLGIGADVEMLGRVPLADVKPLYDMASVLLFTSLRESFGAPFLEALGRGLPTVALDLHGIGDAEVGSAAEKVALPDEPRDLPARIGEALHRVLSDGQWEERSVAAVKWASGWVWPAKIATATEIYHEVASQRR
jgi:glycosyltransferase involved in cell wall biosynthesis